MSDDHISRAVERAVRDSYGRLVAILSSRTRDVAAAEDALSDALLSALRQWPTEGVPANPTSWLLSVARRRLSDGARRAEVRARMAPEIAQLVELIEQTHAGDALPDRRAELLFACADPAIDVGMHTPLMLQVVLGLEANVVASAYLTSPASMAQRLVRAKRKIRDAGIAFRIPDAEERPARVQAVLEALYGAFGVSWDGIDGSAGGSRNLRLEAMHLAEIIHAAIPDDAETMGLLALMSYVDAREPARRDESGRYVPLSLQDPGKWDHAAIHRAERLLLSAAARQQPGRFQLEAAIQSAHLARVLGVGADDVAIAALYDQLVVLTPTVGAYVNRAAAHARAFGAAQGFAMMESLPRVAVDNYQPWWALRAHLLTSLGQLTLARSARERAAALSEDPAVREFLLSSSFSS